jgi:hypothetical protein
MLPCIGLLGRARNWSSLAAHLPRFLKN